MRRRQSTVAVASASLLFLAGCGTNDPGPQASNVTLTMTDFAIDMPDTIDSGLVEVRGVNDGDIIHQAILAELPDGVSAEAYIDAYRADPATALTEADFRGGPQLVRAGSEQTIELELSAGNYVVFCSLPGPEAGQSHLDLGMWDDFTVESDVATGTWAGYPFESEGDDDPSVIPSLRPDGEIELIDWAFDLPETINSGEVYSVTNTGTQVHEIGMASLAEGATRDDVINYLIGQGPEGEPAPFEDLSGVGLLSPGEAQTFPMDAPAGSYVFVCYVLDPDDGLPHFFKGMIQTVDVL